MRLFKQSYKDRRGVQQESSKWYGEFRDHGQQIRRIPLMNDRAASVEVGRKIERLVALRASGDAPDLDLSRWLMVGPQQITRTLVKWGIVDAARIAAIKTLREHLEEYEQDLASCGNSAKHATVTHARAKRVIEGCGFIALADMRADAAKAFLLKLWKEKRISARTYGYYVRDLKAFCKWLVLTGRARENAFVHLGGLGTKALAKDKGKVRKALAGSEIAILLDATAFGPARYEMSGAERSLVYRLAVETGLRASEIAGLTRASFRLDAKLPTVFISGSGTKNGRDAELPLRPSTVALLRGHLKLKMPGSKAFRMPPSTETARMLRADLAAAGIPDKDALGRVVDFHALRHTFLTLLAASGVHPKVAQDLARHSDINLTLSRYSHTILEQRSEAVARLPEFDAQSERRSSGSK